MGQKGSSISNTKGNKLEPQVNPQSNQYEWFKFICDSSEENIFRFLKENSSIINTPMRFNVYKDLRSGEMCSCAFYLEQGLLPESMGSTSAVRVLGKCILCGMCPHVILDLCGETDILKIPSFTEAIFEQDVKIKGPVEDRAYGGLYLIHVLIIIGKTEKLNEIMSHFKLMFTGGSMELTMITDVHYFTPCYLTLVYNQTKCLFDLLQYNEKMIEYWHCEKSTENADHNNPCTLMVSCVKMDRHDILDMLLSRFDRTPSLHTRYLERIYWTEKNTALDYAVGHRKIESMRILTKYNSTVDTQRQNVRKAADLCVTNNDMKLMRAFLELKSKKEFEVCPIFNLIAKGSLEMITLILQALQKKKTLFGSISSDVINVAGRKGNDLLVDALFLHDAQKVKKLLDYGFNSNTFFNGFSLLCWAQILGLDDISHLLVATDGKCFRDKHSQDCCLFLGVISHPSNTLVHVMSLVEQDCDVDYCSLKCTFPLMMAVRYQKFEVFECLLRQGALSNNPSLFTENYLPFRILMKFIVILIKENGELNLEENLSLLKSRTARNAYIPLLRMVLQTTCKVSFETLKDLSSNCKDKKLIEIIYDKVLPPKLMQACRNSLRQHYGQFLWKYIEYIENTIPKRLVRYLQCLDVIEDSYEENENTLEMIGLN
ncbi:uncharacterized protein LOC127706810 [Mytilus californianus]|uniref:uncharacterized protein LOC127706810 n=1 Tax=Mytilus californianus TaxID=6549 RepID=UPI0022479D59|nr:uncharacterized protein LOC127706810 [Mytilus californianus]